jgi:hypothetical protein
MVSPDADLLRALGTVRLRGVIANSVLVLLTILPVAAIQIASRDRVPAASSPSESIVAPQQADQVS